MKYTKLGRSDLTVSRVCMGCMGFGDAGQGQHAWTLDEERSRETIRHGLEMGVNFYDTAIAYQSGTSEQYLGRALRDFTRRDEVVVATKFLPRTQEEIEAGVTGQQHIERMINKSLQNLGMDHVDLYIYHMWDWQTPIEDILDGLNRVVKAGKTRYMYDRMIEESMKNGHGPIIYILPEQSNMIAEQDMVSIHPMGGTMDISILSFSRLAHKVFDKENIYTGDILDDFPCINFFACVISPPKQ